MPSAQTLRRAQNKHYGGRKQLECIGYIEGLLENQTISEYNPVLSELLDKCSEIHGVHKRTLRRWWYCYIEWGLAPFEVKVKMQQYKEKRRMYRRTSTVTDEVVDALRMIVDQNPEYYLDEIADDLLTQTGKYLSIYTIYRTLVDKLQYSLHVCYESALQRNEQHRKLYREALDLLVKDVRQVIFIDQTYTDRNASRRRRA